MTGKTGLPRPLIESNWAPLADATTEPAAPFVLRLFGPLDVRVGETPLPRLRSRKGLWLLALLALRDGRSVNRDWLAGTLWPQCDEIHGRRSLRQTLHDLRNAMGAESWRLAGDEPRTLRLDVSGASVDVLDFDAALERGDRHSLTVAVTLYRGPLLEDCAEEWAVEARQTREQRCLGALQRLAAEATSRCENESAIIWLTSALRLDPFREDLLRALMQSLASDGKPAAALAAYREYRSRLARELMGEPDEETATLFRQLRDGMRAADGVSRHSPAAAPALPVASSPQDRPALPVPLTALIGREEDLRRVLSLAEKSRLLTLTGSGGVGKTRLAIQAASDLAPRFRDGVTFVDLAPVRDAGNLPDAVRAACGAVVRDSRQHPFDSICDHFETRRSLLVLDNCEQLDPACGAFVARLLARCPELTILTTSRQVLGVKGETVWRVPSLAVPGAAPGNRITPLEIEKVADYLEFGSVRLFVDRAEAADSGFRATRRSLVPIAMICSRLDGIPLAIELAAARVKSMSAERIAERLNDRFRILLNKGSLGEDNEFSRHRTLRASIDWSYDLLCPAEQRLLGRLAVFVGGWTLEAAEAICTDEWIHEWEVSELLAALVDKSLVVYQPADDRYRLLETIRQYLLGRPLSDESEAVRAHHLAYFVELAEAAKPELIGPRQTDWNRRLEADHDNIRAALSWARSENGDSEGGLLLVGSIWRFWHVRGYLAEGRAHVAAALAAPSRPTSARSLALNAGATFAYHQSDLGPARALYEESLAIERALNDRSAISYVLNNLGAIALELGDIDAAGAYFGECLSFAREAGDRWLESNNLNNLGRTAFAKGDVDVAQELYDESLRIRRELGDYAGIAISLNAVGAVAARKGDHAAACAIFEESLAMSTRIGDRLKAAQSLHYLGLSFFELGDFEAASRNQLESLRFRFEMGDRKGVVACLCALAGLSLADELSMDSARPARLLGAAETLREDLGIPLDPIIAPYHGGWTARARNGLGAGRFEAEFAAGRALTLAQAVELALACG